MLRDRNFAGVAELLRGKNPERAAFFDVLATALSVSGIPDYLGLIGAAKDAQQADWFRLASVDDALARGRTIQAFELAATAPSGAGLNASWVQRLLAVLQRCFFDAGPDGVTPIDTPRMVEAVQKLAAQLSQDPSSVALRIGLVHLLSPNIAGTTGLAMIAKLVVDLASRPIALNMGFQLGDVGMEWLADHRLFLEPALSWLESEQPILIGRLALPKNLLTEDPDETISALASYLERAPVGDESDIGALQFYLALGASIAPHCTDPDVDLRLYRLVAGKFVSSGFPQYGRDLVEAVFQAGTTTPRRRRLAWFAVADVYLRANDHLAGLVALACTFPADDQADEEEAWEETYAMVRAARDLGLTDIAFASIKEARELLGQMGREKTYGHRLDLLEVQVKLNRLGANKGDELAVLLNDMIAIGRLVLDQADQTAPSGIMIGQLIRAARGAGIPVPPEADQIFAELNKWAGGSVGALIAATSSQVPTADQLAELVTALPSARYAEDVGYDTNIIATLARRVLTDNTTLTDPEIAAFALEVLADWGTALPHWDEKASPPSVPKKDDPPAIARAISADGISVLQLGLDADGRLVRLTTTAGTQGLATCEPLEQFSQKVFHDWSHDFPRRYGLDDNPNIFYTTTAGLHIAELPKEPTIVVASTELQSFPPNIISDGLEFLGRRQPVGAAPSLAWLNAARELNWTGDGRRVAWISTAEGEDGRATLAFLAQLLEAPFAEHAFAVETGPSIPANFTGASTAVLTAHGGVNAEGKYFQVISDEGMLKVSAADLAAVVRNVGVVVLFVCSGGRTDKHPAANTTLGLAKQILDHGCSAVIASPWPLDSQVPPQWLPVFLELWSSGANLMEATYPRTCTSTNFPR